MDKTKAELQEMEVMADDNLSTEEKETSITIPNDLEECIIYSDVSTMIKWVLSIPESEILDYRTIDENIVGVKAKIPKGIIKLKQIPRKSNSHSQMVSYGPNK